MFDILALFVFATSLKIQNMINYFRLELCDILLGNVANNRWRVCGTECLLVMLNFSGDKLITTFNIVLSELFILC